MTAQDIANIRIAEVIKDSPFPLRNYLRPGRKPPPYPMGYQNKTTTFFAAFTKTCAYGTPSQQVSHPPTWRSVTCIRSPSEWLLRNGSTIGVCHPPSPFGGFFLS